MQQPGNNRRGRSKRQRGAHGERQPLTNESTIGLQTKKRSKKANYRVPPSAVDPNYVPGKNPQYADLDEGDDKTPPQRKDGQPRHNGNGVVKGKTTQGDEQRGRRRKRSSKPKHNRSGQPKTTDPQGRTSSPDDRRTSGRPGKNAKGKGQQQRGKQKRRGKGLGMAKKTQSKETGRSKVYTSDMFIYKENLVPDKPVERKMRSRRHKPTDDPPSES